MPVSAAARAAPALAADAACCFATPLHAVAGMSRVHLPPDGLLRLDAAEAEQWRAAFNTEFGSVAIRLHATAPGAHWLLEAPFADAAHDAEPALLAGEALARSVATVPPARALRRLGAEVEMWLASHPLNAERLRRRDAEINALWFWGGGRVTTLSSVQAPDVLATATDVDAWLAGLGAHLQRSVLVARDWAQLMSLAARSPTSPLSAMVVVTPDAAEASGQYWKMLEDRWFAPAAQALARRQITALHLQIGDTAWKVARPSVWGWLRPRRHWSTLLGVTSS